MKDVMLDIETLGVRPTSEIAQIGGCYFDRFTGEIGKEFCVNIDVQTADERFTRDQSTIDWWKKQSPEARRSVFTDGIKIDDALVLFADFLKDAEQIWSHATFDQPIVNNAFAICKIKNPVHYTGGRDIRTLMDLAKASSFGKRTGIHHNALDDCKFQVQYVSEAFNKLFPSV